MSGRAAAVVLLGCGLLLLATTQPWLATVTEAAAGAPRTRGTVTGTELVPWLAPVTVVAALAVVARLVGMRWAGGVAGVAAVAVLAGTARAVVRATSDGGGAGVVSSTPTGWLWVGGAATVLLTVGSVLGWARRHGPAALVRPGGGEPAARPDRVDVERRTDDPEGAEAERRRAAADWRELSDGRDPTDP